MFLLSPILYNKEALGSAAWTANINPFYRVLSSLRHSLIQGDLKLTQALIILLINLAGTIFSVWRLERQRHNLPFLL